MCSPSYYKTTNGYVETKNVIFIYFASLIIRLL